MDEQGTIKRNAYLKALKFKNTGLDEEAIYARLEKQGFPEDIAREVAKNILIKKLEEKEKQVPTPLNHYSVWQWLIYKLFK
jgi:uncharacterized membrane protein